MKNKLINFFSRSSKESVVGFVDKVSSNTIYGWYYNPKAPLEPQTVIAVINSVERTAGKTGNLRKDLRKLGYSNGRHGFEIKVDKNLSEKDEIKVVVEGGKELKQSAGFKKILKVPQPQKSVVSPIFGKIESIKGGIIYGWVIDRKAVHKIFELQIEIDGKDVVSVLNNQFRHHLKARFQKTIAGGFEIDLSDKLCDSKKHQITIKNVKTNEVIDKTFYRSRLINIESKILYNDSNTIVGWCRNKLIPENRLKVELFVNKTIHRIISSSEEISSEFDKTKVTGDYGFTVDLKELPEKSEIILMAANEKIIFKSINKRQY